MQAVWWLALAILAGYGLVVGLAFAFQERLVYFPERELVADPGAIGLAFEEVDIETSDGERLHGWYVPAGGGEGTAPGGEGTAPGGEGTASGGEGTAPGGERPTVLFLHGNAGNISHRLETVQMLHGLDVDLLLIDYRGYGRSSGRPGEAGTYRDADAAWRHLVETRAVSTDRLVVFGRSLGAAIAVELATCRPCAALVIESAF
ncbi:MAG: alpha/beta fold hydrolase, partial [Candidatus Eiseniibacteriota bacterium]